MNVKNEMPIGRRHGDDPGRAEQVVGRADEEARVLEVTEQTEVEPDGGGEERLAHAWPL